MCVYIYIYKWRREKKEVKIETMEHGNKTQFSFFYEHIANWNYRIKSLVRKRGIAEFKTLNITTELRASS